VALAVLNNVLNKILKPWIKPNILPLNAAVTLGGGSILAENDQGTGGSGQPPA